MEDYGIRGAIRDLAEELIPHLKSKRLLDEESAKEQKSILEALARDGVKALELSQVSRKTRKKSKEIPEWGLRHGMSLRYGSDFIILYDGESPEVMHYTVALGSDVMKHIKGDTINRIFEVAQNGKGARDKYDDILYIMHQSRMLMPDNLRPYTHGDANHKTFYWLEDQRRIRDVEYLQELVLKIEKAFYRPEIVAVESVHKVKLEPEFIAARRPIGSFSLIVNYHLQSN